MGLGCHFMSYIFCFGGDGGESDSLVIILVFLGGRVSPQVLLYFFLRGVFVFFK